MEHFAENEVVRVTLDGQFIRLKWAPGITITESAAQTAMAEVNRLCGSTSRPMLVDMNPLIVMNKTGKLVDVVLRNNHPFADAASFVVQEAFCLRHGRNYQRGTHRITITP